MRRKKKKKPKKNLESAEIIDLYERDIEQRELTFTWFDCSAESLACQRKHPTPIGPLCLR